LLHEVTAVVDSSCRMHSKRTRLSRETRRD